MPGLLRGVARTAVIAGTATHVSNNVSRRQADRWAAKDQEQYAQAQAAAPQAPPTGENSDIAELQQLAQLRDQGIITEEEFASKKKQILGI